VSRDQLEMFFKEHDLDHEALTVIRREMTPAGRSRAFINDTPVNLPVLQALGSRLIDIHSQHKNILLGSNAFQLQVLDSFTKRPDLSRSYQEAYKEYQRIEKYFTGLQEQARRSAADLDYLQYQFEQLNKADLENINQTELEEEAEKLSHSEEIKTALSQASFYLDESDENIISNLNSIKNIISKIASYFSKADEIYKRLESVIIEINDIASEIGTENNNLEFNPQQLEQINQKLDKIYTLQTKHNVKTVSELLEIKENLSKKINDINISDDKIKQLYNKETDLKNKSYKLADEIHKIRIKKSHIFSQEITKIIQNLGMPNAEFNIVVSFPPKENEISADFIIFLTKYLKIKLDTLSLRDNDC
jgi:DNA repair protein RecN (Recombination protein N)